MTSDFVNSFFDFSSLRNTSFYKHLLNTGETAHFYSEKVKEAESTGQLYKIVPLAAGSYFCFYGLKNLFRGAVGYDSLQTRQKMAQKALSNEELSYSEKFSLLTNALLGSMKGKQRAVILAKSIVDFAIATLLLYPLLRIGSSPDIDLVEKESLRGAFQEGQIISNLGNRGHAHSLETAQQLYQLQKPLVVQEILNPKMTPNMVQFAERTLNPVESPSKESFNKFVGAACKATVGWTQFADRCKPFSDAQHIPIFSANVDGVTITNKEVLKSACDKTQQTIQTLKPSLVTQGADFAKSICDYTLGLTPWSTKCDALRANMGPMEDKKIQQLSDFANELCTELDKRAQHEDAFKTLFNNTATVNEAATAVNNLAKATLQHSPSANSNNLLGLFCNQHPKKCKSLAHHVFNVSETEALSKEVLAKANRQVQKSNHPDKTGNKNISAAANTLKATFEHNPHLYTGKSTMGILDAFKSAVKFFERPATDPISSDEMNDENLKLDLDAMIEAELAKNKVKKINSSKMQSN